MHDASLKHCRRQDVASPYSPQNHTADNGRCFTGRWPRGGSSAPYFFCYLPPLQEFKNSKFPKQKVIKTFPKPSIKSNWAWNHPSNQIFKTSTHGRNARTYTKQNPYIIIHPLPINKTSQFPKVAVRWSTIGWCTSRLVNWTYANALRPQWQGALGSWRYVFRIELNWIELSQLWYPPDYLKFPNFPVQWGAKWWAPAAWGRPAA